MEKQGRKDGGRTLSISTSFVSMKNVPVCFLGEKPLSFTLPNQRRSHLPEEDWEKVTLAAVCGEMFSQQLSDKGPDLQPVLYCCHFFPEGITGVSSSPEASHSLRSLGLPGV